MPTLGLDLDDGVARVTLDRPPANALDHDVMDEMIALAARLSQPDVGAVVVTGAGRFFSAGLDLFAVLSYSDEQAGRFAASFDEALQLWFGLDRPLVAAVNGHAIAGGTVLAAIADFRLVADAPLKMGLTEILVGVPFPSSALEIVRHSCAGPHLSEVLFRGRTYGPEDAVARRLADEVVPAEELLGRATSLARELAAHRREAFVSTKRALRGETLARMSAARTSGADEAWHTWRTPETRAAMERYRAQAVGKKSG